MTVNREPTKEDLSTESLVTGGGGSDRDEKKMVKGGGSDEVSAKVLAAASDDIDEEEDVCEEEECAVDQQQPFETDALLAMVGSSNRGSGAIKASYLGHFNDLMRMGVGSRASISGSKGGGLEPSPLPVDSKEEEEDGGDSSGQSPPHPPDLLYEAQDYLSMSTLVYIYATLREMALLGYTEMDWRLLDSNSVIPCSPEDRIFLGPGGSVVAPDKPTTTTTTTTAKMTTTTGPQFLRRMSKDELPPQCSHYLRNTKTAGFLMRVILTELEREKHRCKKDEEECPMKTFDTSILKEFKADVDDSRAEQMDSNVAAEIQEMRREVALVRWKRSGLKAKVANMLGHKLSSTNEVLKDKEDLKATEGEANEGITEKMLTSYFKEGSVLKSMVESSFELVWMGDRHSNEAIYCICVNRSTKTVSLVFRGTVNSHNWSYNAKVNMGPRRNPIAHETYEGRSDHFRLHRGFALYLLRKRYNGLYENKLHEVLEMANIVGREMAPDGKFRLSITGHSMGGSLATMVGLYAAAEERFTRVAPVRVFTFAAARVGDQSFLDAYRHLERTGRLLHARFMNTRDPVPLVPTGLTQAGWYKHVGLQIKLHGKTLLRNNKRMHDLDVSYPDSDGWLPTLDRALRNSIFFNINTPAGFLYNHTLSAHQRRVDVARQCQQARANREFLREKRHLKSLEEYYTLRAGIPPTPEHEKWKGNQQKVRAALVVLLVAFVILLVWLCFFVGLETIHGGGHSH